MDSNNLPRGHPPLDPITILGRLEYLDGNTPTPIAYDIDAVIDKGFFFAETDWTCYRRNYFTCQCSFNLTPNYHPNVPIQFVRHSDNNAYPVISFAMSISAVVAEDKDTAQAIDLVQHTPKRDKGPTIQPEKVRMLPKTDQVSHHPIGMYPGSEPGLAGSARSMYGHNAMYAAGHPGPPSSHTFERIQFKQATANNGKRRAAQQYYNLLVELWIECGALPESWLRVAYKRSAKVIVRGRSPGHYQNERRTSAGSGQGGPGSGLTGFSNGSLVAHEFGGSGSGMLSSMSNNYSPFDNRNAGPAGIPYAGSTIRHPIHELPHEPVISPEAAKEIETAREYQYYPETIYEGQHDSRQGIDMYSHPFEPLHHIKPKAEMRSDPDAGNGPVITLPLPSLNLFNPGPLMANRRCSQFDGKSTSNGYYPVLSQGGVSHSHST